MRKNLGAKPYVFPMPVLIIGTYDKLGIPNAMNAAWGTICDYDKIMITLDLGHKTVENIRENQAFTVHIGVANEVVACDYVGIVSGNDEKDKIAKTGWNVQKSEIVDAPLFSELPLALECRLISIDEDSEFVVGKIENVSVDESILDSTGKLDMTKFRPIAYDPANHVYTTMGDVVGKAFQDGKKLK